MNGEESNELWRESPERQRFHELIGGPLKPNDLLADKEGLEKALPLLKDNLVLFRERLYKREEKVDPQRTATTPAGYAIEILDPDNHAAPASPEYVMHVFQQLREAGIKVERVLPATDLSQKIDSNVGREEGASQNN